MAQWITRLTTDQKIPGSNPGELVVFFSQQLLKGLLMQFKALIFFQKVK